jgi:hypothetical protein
MWITVADPYTSGGADAGPRTARLRALDEAVRFRGHRGLPAGHRSEEAGR